MSKFYITKLKNSTVESQQESSERQAPPTAARNQPTKETAGNKLKTSSFLESDKPEPSGYVKRQREKYVEQKKENRCHFLKAKSKLHQNSEKNRNYTIN